MVVSMGASARDMMMEAAMIVPADTWPSITR
jgi:hypothetical protein